MASNVVRGVRSPIPAGKVIGSSVSTGSGAPTLVTPTNPALMQPQGGTGIETNGTVVGIATTGVAANTYALSGITHITVNAQGQITNVT